MCACNCSIIICWSNVYFIRWIFITNELVVTLPKIYPKIVLLSLPFLTDIIHFQNDFWGNCSQNSNPMEPRLSGIPLIGTYFDHAAHRAVAKKCFFFSFLFQLISLERIMLPTNVHVKVDFVPLRSSNFAMRWLFSSFMQNADAKVYQQSNKQKRPIFSPKSYFAHISNQYPKPFFIVFSQQNNNIEILIG